MRRYGRHVPTLFAYQLSLLLQRTIFSFNQQKIFSVVVVITNLYILMPCKKMNNTALILDQQLDNKYIKSDYIKFNKIVSSDIRTQALDCPQNVTVQLPPVCPSDLSQLAPQVPIRGGRHHWAQRLQPGRISRLFQTRY